MDILTIVAGIMIGFIVAKNVIFHEKNNRQRNRQIITISAVLTIVFNIVSYIIYKKIDIITILLPLIIIAFILQLKDYKKINNKNDTEDIYINKKNFIEYTDNCKRKKLLNLNNKDSCKKLKKLLKY